VRLRNWRRQAAFVEHVSDDKKLTAVPLMLEEARAFFAIEGVEAMSAVLRNGDSVDSQRIKAKARAQGITPGRLWKAATWLESEAMDGGPGTTTGIRFSVAARPRRTTALGLGGRIRGLIRG
jgi:hypothetical protein